MNRSLTYALSAIAVLFVLFLLNQRQQSKYNLSSDRIFVNDSESIFGNKGQDYSHNYVRNYDEQEVYRTVENVFYMLNTSPTYWGKNPPKEQPDKEETTIDTTSSLSPL